jgi:hypothetical protein
VSGQYFGSHIGTFGSPSGRFQHRQTRSSGVQDRGATAWRQDEALFRRQRVTRCRKRVDGEKKRRGGEKGDDWLLQCRAWQGSTECFRRYEFTASLIGTTTTTMHQCTLLLSPSSPKPSCLSSIYHRELESHPFNCKSWRVCWPSSSLCTLKSECLLTLLF